MVFISPGVGAAGSVAMPGAVTAGDSTGAADAVGALTPNIEEIAMAETAANFLTFFMHQNLTGNNHELLQHLQITRI